MQLALLLQRRLGRTPDLHPPSNGQSGRGSEYVPRGSVDRYGVNGKIEVEDRYEGRLRQLILSVIAMNHRHPGVSNKYLFDGILSGR